MSSSDYNRIVSTVNSVSSNFSFVPDLNNVIVIDTSNNRIGINNTDPEYSLDISGDVENKYIGIKTPNLTICGGCVHSSLIPKNFGYTDPSFTGPSGENNLGNYYSLGDASNPWYSIYCLSGDFKTVNLDDVSINGRLDISGDVSLNSNVDISGNLILNGSLGVLASSINDISYGNAGALLTSNGPGNSVSWASPYLLRVFLPTTQSAIGSSSFATPVKIVNFSIDNDNTTTNASSNFNTTDDKWTPPAGNYLVNLQLTCYRGADLYQARGLLYQNGSSIREAILQKENNSNGADTIGVSLLISDLIYANGTDCFEFYVGASTPAGNNWHLQGDSSGIQTFFSAYKVA